MLHTALRLPDDASLRSTARTSSPTCTRVLAKMARFADAVRSGEWTGHTGERIRTVVNIGIGGSDLGPVMAYEALRAYSDRALTFRFVSNIDPTDVTEAVLDLDPASTLFIVSSKTFTTQETLTNARAARQWLVEGLERRRVGGREALRRGVDERRGGAQVRHRRGRTCSASGTGSAGATRWTRRSGCR